MIGSADRKGGDGSTEGNCVWVDPRSDPQPPARGLPPRVTEEQSDIAELIQFCKTGRIYSVERWIKAGRPLQVRTDDIGSWRHFETPLVVAIETKQYDLALLLLCNGYDLEVEPASTLDFVVERRAWDFLKLILAWGADRGRADPHLVLGTYNREIIEQFWEAGLDFTEGNALAFYLADSTRNKPAYGWARRHLADPRIGYQLTLALGDAVLENNEKAVSLLVWAGADPHRQVPSLKWGSGVEDDPDDDRESAIECAVHMGHGKLLKHLKPNPDLDDFAQLYAWVCDPITVDCLHDLRPPEDWSKAIVRSAKHLSWRWGNHWASRTCLERIFEHYWGRLSHLEHEECESFRRDLLKMESDWDLSWLLQKLAKPQHCDQAIFAELTRTPSMRQRMKRLELTKLLSKARSASKSPRSTRPGTASSQGVSPAIREEQWLASLDPDRRAAYLKDKISREQLYHEVWAEPVIKVAARYGVSGVAVAKWCKTLNVPRPGRGYWARKVAGYRVAQVPLPKAKRGQKKYLNRPRPRDRDPAPSSTTPPGLELFERPIPVPEALASEHLLVAETRRALKQTEDVERGILRPQVARVLDVWVSESRVDRALQIMNALIQALEGAGFKVEITDILDSKGRVAGHTTSAVIHDERIAFTLSEKVERKERPPNDEERAEMRRRSWKKGPFFEYLPTGLLSLQIESGRYRERHRRTWSDARNRRLEDNLYFFIRSLLLSADLRRRLGKADG